MLNAFQTLFPLAGLAGMPRLFQMTASGSAESTEEQSKNGTPVDTHWHGLSKVISLTSPNAPETVWLQKQMSLLCGEW